MLYFPAPPEVADDQQSAGELFLRYEDICQDGRVLLQALPQGMGIAVWRDLLLHHPVTQLSKSKGIIPILTRLVLSGQDGRLSVNFPVKCRGRFALAHSNGPSGDLARLHMNAWVEVEGPAGKTTDPLGTPPGPTVKVGQLFAEHVFTRLFAPPDERKVLALEHEALPSVPDCEYTWRPRKSVLELPEGAAWLDESLSIASSMAFGLSHTDSNQHVNSLVYLKLFEEAALQHLVDLGRSSVLLARYAEIAYRKPCFAGDRVQIAMRGFVLDGNPGAVGCFLPGDAESAASTKSAHCFVRILFAP